MIAGGVKGVFDFSFVNPDRLSGWEERACENRECLAYGQKSPACWLQKKEPGAGEAAAAPEGEPGTCAQCPIYLHAVRQSKYRIGESFNELMDMLRRRHEALRASEERYRTLVETIPYGIEENDLSGIVTFTNRTQRRMHGCTEKDVVGKPFWE